MISYQAYNFKILFLLLLLALTATFFIIIMEFVIFKPSYNFVNYIANFYHYYYCH